MAKRIAESTFNAYQLGESLGQGGAGWVFAATDTEGYIWAVKVLRPDQVTDDRRKRFKNEIEFCRPGRHSNIVEVVDDGLVEIEGKKTPFYVMPRFQGSLRSVMRHLAAAEAKLASYNQILDGLEAAHLAGVTHRDVKPENVLVTPDHQRFVVADFGIARFTVEELYTAVETRVGSRLANFVYAAPEQKRRGESVDQRADIFALGLILNELFTGHVPQGTGYRTVGQVDGELAWIDEVVAMMLQQDPAERLNSVSAVKDALIGHKDSHVTRQRLDELSKRVVPTTEVTDSYAERPLEIVDFEVGNGELVLTLDRPATPKWREALLSMGSYSSALGRPPEAIHFSGNMARIQLYTGDDAEVQLLINHFLAWMPKAMVRYKQIAERALREKEAMQREHLRAEQEKLEQRERLKRNIKFRRET